MDGRDEGELLQRRLSSKSSKTLTTLNLLEKRVREYEQELRQLDSDEGPSVKNRLAQIVGELDSIEFKDVDSIITSSLHSGKVAARHTRKALIARIEALRDHASELYKILDKPMSVATDTPAEHPPQGDPESSELIKINHHATPIPQPAPLDRPQSTNAPDTKEESQMEPQETPSRAHQIKINFVTDSKAESVQTRDKDTRRLRGPTERAVVFPAECQAQQEEQLQRRRFNASRKRRAAQRKYRSSSVPPIHVYYAPRNNLPFFSYDQPPFFF